GVIYEADLLAPVSCSTRGESCRTVTSFGLLGGKPGAISRVSFAPVGGGEAELPQYANVDLQPGRLLIEAGGGGGFGDPFERPAEEVLRDVRDGVVSLVAARGDYGVAVRPGTLEVDAQETGRLRKRR
ncbi:MAG: hydantoinase B/oxoprolinase family protein, partial [Nitrospinota bacterium]